jgi:type I restriction enzyme M protein
LKEINGFTYDHSERLGDAFEYLLSVLGSQGDAGQFRTPRHIIDFMVAVVNPQKTDTILDPACGTAGFLISAWKHILKANTSPDSKILGDRLTPDERTRLASGIRGYDISPDMVRLSLVNLYLHGFAEPNVVEYDTLTQDDKWNELADVILANPPFMSPKGGIKPHKRFSVQATRSEVLFVDYMAEHLTARGRAAIVVPEGIIFQGGTAYKALRKMLVENCLVAVVSLPAGVFNPYSGVKTSILILDKRVHKHTDSVLFVKVQNDGFNLGAQRRAVANSDLPVAARILRNWIAAPQTYEGDGPTTQAVARARIAEGADFTLSSDRYRAGERPASAIAPLVELGTICTFMTGGTPTSSIREYYDGGTVPWLVSGDIHKGRIVDCAGRITAEGVANSNARVLPFNSVLIALNGQGKTRGTVALLKMHNATCNQSLVAIRSQDEEVLLPDYLHAVLDSMYQEIRDLTGDEQRSGLNIPILKTIRIPLPRLEVQRQIVAEIEGYQKVIEGARQVLDGYQVHVLIDPAWPTVTLGEIADFKNGLNYDADDAGTAIKMFGVGHFKDHLIAKFSELPEVQVNGVVDDAYLLRSGDLLFVRSNGNPALVGRSVLIPETDERVTFSGFTIRCRFHGDIVPKFYALLFKSVLHRELFKDAGRGAGIRNLSQGMLKEVKVPLPDLPTQRAIVAEIEAEQDLVNANRELVHRMEAKIKAAVDRVWGIGE